MFRTDKRIVCALLSVFMLAACGYYSNGEFGPQDQRDFAKHFVGLFATRDTAAIDRQLDPSLKVQIDPELGPMFAVYPRGNATSVQAYNYTIRSDTSSGTVYFVQLLYEFPADKDMTAEVALAHSGATYTVKGVHFHAFPRSALAMNDFSLKRIPPSGYFILAMLIGAVGITICALIACVTTHGIRRKWLWILFILIGFGKVSLNWTTGQLFFAPLSFQLLSAGIMRSGLGPWVVSVSVPLGAIVFLVKRKSLAGIVESPVVDTGID